MATDVTLDVSTFNLRLTRLLDIWNSGYTETSSGWNGVDAIIFLSGRQDEDRPTPKTDQCHLWLFGYVFPETFIVVLRNRTIFFLTGPKKLTVLKQLQRDGLVFLEKSNTDNNEANLKKIVEAIEGLQSPTNSESDAVGKNEETIGTFVQQIEDVLKTTVPVGEFEEVAIDGAIAVLLAIHDTKSLTCSAKAASLAIRLAKDVLIHRVEHVLDKECIESHSDIASRAEKALDDPKKQERWKTKFNLEPDSLDVVYVNVQSGQKCDLKPSAQASTDPLYIGPGTIIVSIGTKYQDYTANLVRTLLFNTTKEKKTTYQFTLEVLEMAIANLVPGKTFTEVYETVKNFVEAKAPHLLQHMTRTIAHTLGIEFRESLLTVNGKSTGIVTPNMVFNVSFGFANVPSVESPGTTYSVWLADSVQVMAEGAPKVLTVELDKKLKAINYELSDDPPVDGDGGEKKESSNNVASSNTVGEIKTEASTNGVKVKGTKEGASKSVSLQSNKQKQRPSADNSKSSPVSKRPRGEGGTTAPSSSPTKGQSGESVVLRDRLRSRSRASNSDEIEKLLERQTILRIRKVQEIQERFKDGGGKNFSTNKKSTRKMTSLTAYRDPTDYPKDLKPNRIALDLVKESVLIPVPEFGHVPFHVSTIRNVFNQAEDKKFQTLRIQFQVPGSTTLGTKSEDNPFPELSVPNGLFIKELIFRSSDPSLQSTYRNIKELQKRMKQREESGDTSQDLAVQKPLELNRKGGKRIILKSLMVKHGANNRRVGGTLEAHQNGLRFTSSRSENIDINYANIKHGLFQPCENELLVLIHFHLKNAILISKKKVSDIQFYTEIGSQTDDLDQRRGRSSYDPDEIAEEQRERELKKRLNIEFKRFVEAVEQMARANGDILEFDVPYRELSFFGVPKNSSQLMLPTANCLVQLSEWPVFVLSLEDIEIVSFERVYHGLRQFDIVFVFKDYSKSIRQITTVPIESLDTIKRWLNEIDIVWYESKGNLNWPQVLKTIREDITAFVDDGGFGIFLGEEEGSVGSCGAGGEGGGDTDSDDGDEEYKDSPSETSEEFGDGSDDDDDDEDDDDDDDEDDESLADENSSEGSYSDDEDSDEKGLTWAELEKQALKDDKKRGHDRDEDDDEDARRKKRRKNKP